MPQFIIPPDAVGERLDKALAKFLPEFSRAYWQQLLVAEKVFVDGKLESGKYRLKGDETITYEAEPIDDPKQWQPENIPLDVVYQDDDLLVVNKPVGLVVHPGAGNWTGTLVNGLLHAYPALAQLPRAGIVHRLDRETSGLLVVAKTRTAHHHLVKQLQKHHIQREYQALVYGEMTAGGTINAPIGRNPHDRLKMGIAESGRNAVTHYRLAERFKGFTLLNVQLETGRTHQIRVHLSSVLHPIVGDPLYGKGLRLPKGASPELIEALRQFTHQALHAKKLSFTHPTSQEVVEVLAPLPADFQELLNVIKLC